MSGCHLLVHFKYQGKLAGGNDEYNPVINAWSSTISNESGLSVAEIEWEDEKKQISKQNSIKIALQNTESLSQDSSVWLEVVADGVNEDNVPVGVRAGMTQILLRDVVEAHSKGKDYDAKFNLELPTYELKSGPYTKGKIRVIISKEENEHVKAFNFKPLSRFDYVEENQEFIGTMLNDTMQSVMFPYGKRAKKENLAFEPTSTNLEGFNAPLWQNNVILPIANYFQQYSEMAHDEHTMKNMAKVTLARCGIDDEAFTTVVNNQMKERGSNYDVRFTEMVTATVSTLCLLSTSMPYKSDETFRVRGKGKGVKRVSIESFNDALRMGGDDCEGLAEIIHRVARVLEMGDPKKADANVSWKKHGSWDDPVLQSMQQIMHIMVPLGTLGEVTSSRLGNSKEANKNNPLIIDSDEDVNHVEFGFHMWWEHMSLHDFEKRINQNIDDPKNHFHLYPEEGPLPEWHSKIPHLIGEGTGSLFPLLRPLSEYYSESNNSKKEKSINATVSKQIIKQAESLHKAKLSSFEIATKNAISLQLAQVEKQPELTTHHADARLSGFYRRSTNAYTDKLKREGYNMSEFIWVENKPRVPESESHVFAKGEEFSSNKWRWGVNVRDKLYKKQDISLLPIPTLSDEEELLYRSLSKHMSPTISPYLSAERETQLRNKIEPELAKFQIQLDKLNQTKTANNRQLNHPLIKQHFIYRGNLFFSAKLKDGTTLQQQILKDLSNNANIVNSSVVFEPITDAFYNVRLTTEVITPETNQLKMDHSFSKDKTMGNFLDFNMPLKKTSTLKVANKQSLKEVTELSFKNKDLALAFIEGINNRELSSSKTKAQLKAHANGLLFAKEGFVLK